MAWRRHHAVPWCDGRMVHGPKGANQGAKELAKGAKELGQRGIQLPWFVLPIFSKKILNFEKDLEK